MKVTQVLMDEHLLILKVLALLKKSREELENGRNVPALFFEKAMGFCSEFADQYHHFKEEFLLFGLLSHRQKGGLDSAMGTLRYQHETCRHCIAQIKQAVPGVAENDEMAITLLLESLAVYVSLLRRHIYLEDQIFFPMAEEVLSMDEKKSLAAQFTQEESRNSPQGSVFDKNKIVGDELAVILKSR